MYLNILLFIYYLVISSFLEDLWSSGYDITLTRWGSAVRIRPDPFFIFSTNLLCNKFIFINCATSSVRYTNRLRASWAQPAHYDTQIGCVRAERNQLLQEFPSGQRGTAKNRVLSASQVRILFPALFFLFLINVIRVYKDQYHSP